MEILILNVPHVSGEELCSLTTEPNNIWRFSKGSSTVSEKDLLDDNSTAGQRVVSGMLPVQRRESLLAEKANIEVTLVGHQKTLSEPVDSTTSCNNNKQMPSDIKNLSNNRLEEYHKWKVSGCKGDPPAKLKISQ